MTWKNQKPPSGMPARGASTSKGRGPKHEPFDAANQPSPEAKSIGHEVAKTAREVAVATAVEAALFMRDLMRDDAAPLPTRLDAANKIVERAEGRPAASVDLTSKGEAIGGGYVIAAPPEITDSGEWAKQHKPR